LQTDLFTTQADDSRGAKVFTGVCLSVCFPHDISKSDAASITKLDKQMLHEESFKLIYFWVKGQGHGSTGVGHCSLVSEWWLINVVHVKDDVVAENRAKN